MESRPPSNHHASIEDAQSNAILKEGDGFALVMVMALAFSLRLLLACLGPGLDITLANHPDTTSYAQLGHSLIEHQTFAWPENLNEDSIDADLQRVNTALGQTELTAVTGGLIETRRTPGYAWVIGVIQAAGLPLHVLLGLQLLASTACVGLVYVLMRAVFSEAQYSPLIASAIVAIHPAFISSSLAFTPACLAISLLLGGMTLAFCNTERHNERALLSGLCLGVSQLLMPIHLLVGAVVAVGMAVHQGVHWRLRSVLILLICATVIPASWVYRNHNVSGLTTLSTGPIINTYYEGLLPSKADNQEETQNKNRLRESRTAAWFSATEDSDSQHAIDAMQQLTHERRWENGVLNGLQQATRQLIYKATAENIRPALAQLGIEQTVAGTSRDLTSLATGSRPGDDQAVYQIASVWILFSSVLNTLAVTGLTLLALRRQWSYVMTFGGMWLICLWMKANPMADPFLTAPLTLIPVLVATTFSPIPAPVRKRKKRKKKRQTQGPEFNLYGLPTHYYQNETDETEVQTDDLATKPTSTPTWAQAPQTSDAAPTPEPEQTPQANTFAFNTKPTTTTTNNNNNNNNNNNPSTTKTTSSGVQSHDGSQASSLFAPPSDSNQAPHPSNPPTQPSTNLYPTPKRSA